MWVVGEDLAAIVGDEAEGVVWGPAEEAPQVIPQNRCSLKDK